MFASKTRILTLAIAAVAAGAPLVAAGAPAQAPAAVTVEGCLFREADVPGRRPTPYDRPNVLAANNYVLANTTMATGTQPEGAPGPLLYKVTKLNKGDLRKLVDKRVQIDGTFTKTDRAPLPVSINTNLVELEGTAVREVGSCAAK